jgi:hypothetical protein
MDPGLGGGSDAISKDISVSNSTFSICGALYARFFCACPLISVVFIAWIPLFLNKYFLLLDERAALYGEVVDSGWNV